MSHPPLDLNGVRSIQMLPWCKLDRQCLTTSADLLLLDLEDGVKREDLPRARQAIGAFLQAGNGRKHPTALRINARSCPDEVIRDLELAVHPDLVCIMLPKLDCPDDVLWFEQLLARALPERQIPLLTAIIETRRGVVHLEQILAASDRIAMVNVGNADLAWDYHVEPDSKLLHNVRAKIALTARSLNLPVIDTPCFSVADPNLIARECRLSRALGFQGKIVLNAKHVALVNEVFTPSATELAWARKVREAEAEGLVTLEGESDRFFIGPPHHQRAKRLLAEAPPAPQVPSGSSRARWAARRGAWREHCIGRLVAIPGDLTLDQAMSERWNRSFFNANRLENSAVAARVAGLEARLIPFGLLMSLTAGLAVPYLSEVSRYHLAFSDVLQVRPVYGGQTVRAVFMISAVRPTSNGRDQVVESRHALLDQEDRLLMRVTKHTLFQRMTWQKDLQQLAHNSVLLTGEPLLQAQLLKSDVVAKLNFDPQPQLSPGDLLVHRFVKAFSPDESRGLSNLLRATNPHHHDQFRFTPTQLVVPGPCVLAAGIAACLDDLGDTLYQEIAHYSHYNRTNLDTQVGTLTKVLAIEPTQNLKLERVTLKTLVVMDSNMQTLVGQPLPDQIFSAEPMKPSHFEDICRRQCPALHHRVACQAVRTIIRPRPIA